MKIGDPVVRMALDDCQKYKTRKKEAIRQSAAQIRLLAELAALEEEQANAIPVFWGIPLCSEWTWRRILQPVRHYREARYG
jgi:hypothetical protein